MMTSGIGGRVRPRANVPRRRVVRARVGVLEDVRGAAGDGLGSSWGNECAWERFSCCKPPRGGIVRRRGRVVYAAAHWRSTIVTQINLAITYLQRTLERP